MKRIPIIALFLMLIAITANAQSFVLNNATDCTFYFRVVASDPTCGTSSATVMYVVPPHSSVSWSSFTAATWAGTVPTTGWSWTAINITGVPGASCGPFTAGGVPPACGSNLAQMGSGTCFPFLNVACMYMNTSPGCNTCKYTRDEWINYPGGNVIVNMG